MVWLLEILVGLAGLLLQAAWIGLGGHGEPVPTSTPAECITERAVPVTDGQAEDRSTTVAPSTSRRLQRDGCPDSFLWETPSARADLPITLAFCEIAGRPRVIGSHRALPALFTLLLSNSPLASCPQCFFQTHTGSSRLRPSRLQVGMQT